MLFPFKRRNVKCNIQVRGVDDKHVVLSQHAAVFRVKRHKKKIVPFKINCKKNVS